MWSETKLLEFQTRGEVSEEIRSGDRSQAPIGPVSLWELPGRRNMVDAVGKWKDQDILKAGRWWQHRGGNPRCVAEEEEEGKQSPGGSENSGLRKQKEITLSP